MKGFNFKLEKILDYKKVVENYKKGEYGAIKKTLDVEEEKLEAFNSYKVHIESEMNKTIARTNAGNLAMYNRYIDDITGKIREQEQIIDKTKEELQAAKDAMIVAAQEKKTFEKLREREHEEYLDKMKKTEEKQVDALITYRTSIQ
ncbi:MAG: flagellar export protein FliJ [Tissierellia bacterium]|nr:flagellar export protein FliJ [Tissierellia bacterium]